MGQLTDPDPGGDNTAPRNITVDLVFYTAAH